MVQSTIIATLDGNYRPHDYIRQAIEEMKDYCLPYRQVRIANPDTGIIVALILYIIAREPTVNHTKLECYIILLNRMIKDATGTELFTWKLNSRGLIGNFNKFFKHMKGRELIQPNGRSNLVIRNSASVRSILPRLETIILRNLIPYLSKLLTKYENYTAKAMLEEIQRQNNGTDAY